jgi:hypothetical protein
MTTELSFRVLQGPLLVFGVIVNSTVTLFAAEHEPQADPPPAVGTAETTPLLPETTEPADQKADPGGVEVLFTDNSSMKLSLKEQAIDLTTPYGRLIIPVADIHRVELAMRIPDDVAQRIDSAIAGLGDPDFRTRQASSNELMSLKQKAYSALLKATEHSDPEVATRAKEIIAKIRAGLPPDLLEVRHHDVIYTATSKFAGRIQMTSVKVHTFQFGEQLLKLSDVHHIRSLSAPDITDDDAGAEAGPPNLSELNVEIGRTFRYRVTGSRNGPIWGTDVYTTDSNLATAAVHAGLLEPGQTGVLKVTIVPPPNSFAGSLRHGIRSLSYGSYPAAYRIHK